MGDCIPTVRGRRVPVEVDDRRARGRRRQVPGYARYPGRHRGGVRVCRGPEGVVGVQRPDLVVAGVARRETRMLVLGRGRRRQEREVDTAIRRHVHLVTADRLPTGRGRYVPVEVDDGGPDGDRCQIAGCTRRPRAPRCGGARDDVRRASSPNGVGRGDAIVQGCAWKATGMLVVCGHSGPDRDPARGAVCGRLDPVLGDRTPTVRVRLIPVEEDGVGIEGGRPQVLRRPGYRVAALTVKRVRGRCEGKPADRRGGNHEGSGW